MKNFFDVMYSAPKDLIKQLKKGTVERKLKRQFESAFDNTVDEIMKLQECIKKEFEDIESMDLKDIQEAYLWIQDYKKNIDMIKELYLWIFWEEMKTDYIDVDLFSTEEEQLDIKI